MLDSNVNENEDWSSNGNLENEIARILGAMLHHIVENEELDMEPCESPKNKGCIEFGRIFNAFMSMIT